MPTPLEKRLLLFSGSVGLAPPVITTPTAAQVFTTTTPTFQWSRSASDPADGSVLYDVAITQAGTPVTLTGATNVNGTSYAGSPALTVGLPYVIIVTGHGTRGTAASAPVTFGVAAVFDQFTDTNGVLISAHTPNLRPGSNAWALMTNTGAAPTAGTGTINGNTLQFANNANGAVIDTGIVDGTITVSWTPNASRDNVMARAGTGGNEWRFNVNQLDGVVNIVEDASGTPTTRATAAFAFTSLQTYALKVTVIAGVMTCYIDGTQVLTYATMTTGLSATKAGVGRGTSTNAGKFDNFEVAPF